MGGGKGTQSVWLSDQSFTVVTRSNEWSRFETGILSSELFIDVCTNREYPLIIVIKGNIEKSRIAAALGNVDFKCEHMVGSKNLPFQFK